MSLSQMASRKRRQTSVGSYSDCSEDASPAPRSNRPIKSSVPRASERCTRADTPDSASDSDDYPEEYAEYLACPFWKHNPRRYAHVRDTCTTGWGFADCGKLTEHIRRVHTRSLGCVRCGHRFTNITKNNLQNVKKGHQCKLEDVGKFDLNSKLAPEWLSEQQEEKYNKLTFPRGNSSETPQAVFEKIYRALWPEDAAHKGVPSHYHKPGPMQPTYKLEQKDRQLRQKDEQLLQKQDKLNQAEERIRQLEALAAQLQNQTLNGPARKYDSSPEYQSPMVPRRLTYDIKENRTHEAGMRPRLAEAETHGRYVPSGLGQMLTDGVEPFEYALPKGVNSEGRDSGVGLSEEGADMDKDLLFGSTIDSDPAWWPGAEMPDITTYDWSDDHSLDLMEH